MSSLVDIQYSVLPVVPQTDGDSLDQAALVQKLDRLRLLTSLDLGRVTDSLDTLEKAWMAWPQERELTVASVNRFIASLPIDAATIWSGRARWLGKGDFCPLVKIAKHPARSYVDRFRASFLLATVYSDQELLGRMLLTVDRDRNADQLEILIAELAIVEPRAAFWLARSSGLRQASIPRDGSMQVAWHGSILNSSGFADEARGFLRNLRPGEVRAGHYGVTDEYISEAIVSDPDSVIARDLELPELDREIVVTNFSVTTPIEQFWRPGRLEDVMVVRTMFETDGLPKDAVSTMNLVDEIWVATKFNATTFKEAGVTSPIHVVRGGIDRSRVKRSAPIYSGEVTRFLSIFDWQPRKGWKYLIEAWAAAFTSKDLVELTLKVSRFGVGESSSERQRLSLELDQEIDSHLQSLGLDRKDMATVLLDTRPLSDSEFFNIYQESDVFVLPSCGEGWGRPYMQAMSAGMPTIATNWSGQTEFMNYSNSLLVDVADLVDADPDAAGGIFAGQRWARPDVRHLADLMISAHRDRGEMIRLGVRASSDIANGWTWERVVADAENRLRSIEEIMDRESAIREKARSEAGERSAVRWKGEFFGSGSLAKVNLSLVQQYLIGKGDLDFVLTIDHVGPIRRNPRRTIERLGGSLAELRSDLVSRGLEIRHSWPPDFSSSDGRLVVIFPWEFHQVPTRWVSRINRNVDRLITPSQWTKSILIENGVDPERVVVVPNGIDPDVYTPMGRRFELASKKSHRFLFVGGLIFRKGFDVMLETYCETFTAQDDVVLIIKAGELAGVYSYNSMVTKLQEAMAVPGYPEIILLGEELSEQEMASLYRSCDTLVHPYRGEGFGMPILEAVACGLPVVVPDYGPAVEYVHADSTLWIGGAGQTP
ncbi:MAG: glycosyltransferase family 4 protein, partial [Acidimicrobiaceae bacterium]|nr:glycosyltransferase family 4 protein [Acidimicrobiaceae bacterium]